MFVRVAIAALAAVALVAPPAAAEKVWDPFRVIMNEPVVGCPKIDDAVALAAGVKEDPAAAFRAAERKGCTLLPQRLVGYLTEVDVNKKASCVVPLAGKRCYWVPSDKTDIVDIDEALGSKP